MASYISDFGVETHFLSLKWISFINILERKQPEMFATNEVCDLFISFFLSFNHPKRSLVSSGKDSLGMHSNEAVSQFSGSPGTSPSPSTRHRCCAGNRSRQQLGNQGCPADDLK